MARNVLKKSLVSLLGLFMISCTVPSGYSRQEIDTIIKETYKKEFDLDVSVWMIDDSLWLYAPLKLFDENGQYLGNGKGRLNQDLSDNKRRIIHSLTRIFLNMEKPPHFYFVIIADTKQLGLDHYIVSFVPDRIKVDRALISPTDYWSRVASFAIYDPRILGDSNGKHLQLYDMGMQEFISISLEKDIIMEFISEEKKDNFEINSIEVTYNDNAFKVDYDITAKETDKKPSQPLDTELLDEVEEVVKKIFERYLPFLIVGEVIITDLPNKQARELNFSVAKSPDITLEGDENTVDLTLGDLQRVNFYYTQGYRYQQDANLDKAKDSYLKVLEIMPEHVYSLTSLGTVYISLSQPKQAVPFLERAIVIYPKNHESHYLLAQAYIALGQIDKAIQELKTTLEIKPKLGIASHTLGLIYTNLGKYKEAIEHLQKASETDTDNPELHRLVGSAYSALGNHSLALTYYQKALDKDPENIQTLVALGQTLYNLNRSRDAIPHLEKAAKISPESAAIYYWLGKASVSLSQYNKALEHYLKVRELSPQYAPNHAELGSIYRYLNKPKKAQESFQKAKDLYTQQQNFDAARELDQFLGSTFP